MIPFPLFSDENSAFLTKKKIGLKYEKLEKDPRLKTRLILGL